MRHLAPRQEGAALALALVAIALLTALGASLLQQVRYEVRLSKTEASGEQALSAAEAGFNIAFAWARAGPLLQGETLDPPLVRDLTYDTGSEVITTGQYTAELSRLDIASVCYFIKSVGSVQTQGGRTVRREVKGFVRRVTATSWRWCYDCDQGEVGCT